MPPAGLSTEGIQGFWQRPLPSLMILWSNSWALGERCTQDSSWIIRDAGEKQPLAPPLRRAAGDAGLPHTNPPAGIGSPSPVSRAITWGSGLDLHLQPPFPRGQAGLSSFWGADPILDSLGTQEELE